MIVAADSEDAGAGRLAAETLAERARQMGWQESVWPAPTGTDWNDVLRGVKL
ncbi:MAG: toprim domain-containing protein [Rhodobacteraceae bacterium]|nr:toprim domain-containing protein [Paracoccaceae bacterium]